MYKCIYLSLFEQLGLKDDMFDRKGDVTDREGFY